VESNIFTLAEAKIISGPPFPLVIEPAREDIDAVAWAAAQRHSLRELALDELRAAYEAETVVIPWQEGDSLMLDNMLVAHGREDYKPSRQIVVAMAEPWSRVKGL
jgi:hypothetical protein